MEKQDVKEGNIVYLQFMHFPDTNTIDYRLKGRPYLVYKILEDKVYLFEMRTGKHAVSEFFYKIQKSKIR